MKTLKYYLLPVFLVTFCLNLAQAQEEYCYFYIGSTASGYNQVLVYEHYSPIIKYDPSDVSLNEIRRSWYDYLVDNNYKQSFNSFNSYTPAKIDRRSKSDLISWKNKEFQKSKSLDRQYNHHFTIDYAKDYFALVRMGEWSRWEYHHLIDQ